MFISGAFDVMSTLDTPKINVTCEDEFGTTIKKMRFDSEGNPI